jgi:hypothetical protein
MSTERHASSFAIANSGHLTDSTAVDCQLQLEVAANTFAFGDISFTIRVHVPRCSSRPSLPSISSLCLCAWPHINWPGAWPIAYCILHIAYCMLHFLFLTQSSSSRRRVCLLPHHIVQRIFWVVTSVGAIARRLASYYGDFTHLSHQDVLTISLSPETERLAVGILPGLGLADILISWRHVRQGDAQKGPRTTTWRARLRRGRWVAQGCTACPSPIFASPGVLQSAAQANLDVTHVRRRILSTAPSNSFILRA